MNRLTLKSRQVLLALSATLALTLPGIPALAVEDDTAASPTTTSTAASNPEAETTTYNLTRGTLEWALRDTFLNYMTNPGFHPRISAGHGAKHIPASEGNKQTLQWGEGYGKCVGNTCTINYLGDIRFRSHPSATNPNEYQLDMTLKKLIIETDGKTGKLYADARSKTLGGGPELSNSKLPLANLTLQENPQVNEGKITINATATLAKEAEPYFAGYYDSTNDGALAPLTITADARQPGVADSDGIIRERPVDNPLNSKGMRWAFSSSFKQQAGERGIVTNVYGAHPVSDTIDWSKYTGEVDESKNLAITYGASLVFSRQESGTNSKTPVLTIANPRLLIKSNSGGDLYLSVQKEGEAEAKEILYGTFSCPIYTNFNDFTIFANNCQIKPGSDSALTVSGMDTITNLDPLSFHIAFDQLAPYSETAKRVAISQAIYNTPRPQWTNREPLFDTPTAPATDPYVPPKRPTVEEENALGRFANAGFPELGEFRWGIKQSWQSYVGGPKTSKLVGATYRDGDYVWASGTATQSENGDYHLHFKGSVNFSAHDDILSLSFANPHLVIPGNEGDTQVYMQVGNFSGGGKEIFMGTIKGRPEIVSTAKEGRNYAAIIGNNLPFYLSREAEPYFAGVYREGLRMDNVSFRVELEWGEDSGDLPGTGGSQPGPGTKPNPGGSGSVPNQPNTSGVKTAFTDIASYPFAKEIEWLASTGITTGYADKTFRPNDSVSRAAMAAFIYRLEGKPAYEAPKQSPFRDIKPGDDFYKEICWLASKGITTGYADGTFKPWDPIARDAMAAFLHRYDQKVAAKKLATKLAAKNFTDTASTPFAKDIAWLSQTGVTTGYQDGSFRPFENIERGAIAAFFYRMKH